MIVLAARWALHRLALHSGTPYLISEITALTRQAAALRAENAAYTQLAQFGSYFAASSAQLKGVSRLQSYVHGACTTPLLGDTIGYNLTRTAEEHPNLLAVSSISQQVSSTYATTYGTPCKQKCQHNTAADAPELSRLSLPCHEHGSRASGYWCGTW